jgi:hypothetical protein
VLVEIVETGRFHGERGATLSVRTFEEEMVVQWRGAPEREEGRVRNTDDRDQTKVGG